MECVWCLFLMGHLQDENRNRSQLPGCGQALITVGGTASPGRRVEEWTLAANEPGHLSDDDDTAGSGPDLMQWVNVTDLVGDAS